jgi:hypothetical protein
MNATFKFLFRKTTFTCNLKNQPDKKQCFNNYKFMIPINIKAKSSMNVLIIIISQKHSTELCKNNL